MTLEQAKNYKSLDSYRYFSCGWVLHTEWKLYSEEEIVLVVGKVRHSYAATKDPLKPWVLIKCSGAVLVGHCTCMAGLAETCSHVGAILHWVEAAVRIEKNVACTSQENKWIMPTPKENIPYLELREIEFRAPKRLKLEPGSDSSPLKCISNLVNDCKVTPPSQDERDDFFREIAKEKERKPIILSVIEPHSSMFTESNDHLPIALQNIFNPAHLEKDYDQLVMLAKNFSSTHSVTQEMVEHLAKITCDQSKSKSWFRFRAGRITASRFKQTVCTNPDQPSLSLLKNICYPEINKFTTAATEWGCEHEMIGIQAYQTHMISHEEFVITKSGLHISLDHPFLGASPDALIECKCCGKGVVEIKCPYNCRDRSLDDVSRKSFCLKKLSDGTLRLKHDHSYYYQCQMQIFATKREFCDFVVWSSNELHVERLTLDEDLMASSISIAEKFWKLCVLPELLGKWFTCHKLPNCNVETEVDSGSWCFCKEDRGGGMIGCDGKSCEIKWFHLTCLGMTESSTPKGKWFCPTAKVMNA